jgi:hypothetical protein
MRDMRNYYKKLERLKKYKLVGKIMKKMKNNRKYNKNISNRK